MLSLVIMIAVSNAKPQFISILYNSASIILGFAYILLFLTLLLGHSTHTSVRWIRLFGISIQTTEIIKLAIIIYVAKQLTDYVFAPKKFKIIMTKTAAAITPLIAIILLQNLSSAIIISAIVYLMLYIANVPKDFFKKLTIALAVVAFSFFLIVALFNIPFYRFPTWHNRIDSMFKTHKTSIQDITSQNLQAKVAIAKGNIFTFRPGKSTQKYVIKQAFTDYVFSIIAEEYGLIGIALIIFIYMSIFSSILKIHSKTTRAFSSFLCVGFGLNLMLQTFIHILVNIGWLPVTGQPLPFLSIGGTYILVDSFMLGVILNISKNNATKSKPKPNSPSDYQFSSAKPTIINI